MKKEAGYEKLEEYAAVKDADQERTTVKLNETLTAMNAKIKAMIEAARRRRQSSKGRRVKQRPPTRSSTNSRSEPNQSFLSRQARMLELVDNMTQSTTSYSLDNERLRKDLADVNGVNAEQVAVTTKSAQAAEAAKLKAETETQTVNQQLHDQVDKLGTDLAARVEEVTKLTSQIEQMKTENAKMVGDLVMALRRTRDRGREDHEISMETASGRIRFVDNTRHEVRTTLTRRRGGPSATDFQRLRGDSPGVPTDKPKGTIELIQVGDQLQHRPDREDEQADRSDPYGDIVYSPAWSPNEPMRFALIGKIDVNRDGRDDREDLKRMIRASGGDVTTTCPRPTSGRRLASSVR